MRIISGWIRLIRFWSHQTSTLLMSPMLLASRLIRRAFNHLSRVTMNWLERWKFRELRNRLTTNADVGQIAGKYLKAVQEAAQTFRHVESAKGPGTFITEVSMDETDKPQTPVELLVILA